MGTQENGGARRDRTVDLLHAMQALSQLSYGPIQRGRILRNYPWSVNALRRRWPSVEPPERLLPAEDRQRLVDRAARRCRPRPPLGSAGPPFRAPGHRPQPAPGSPRGSAAAVQSVKFRERRARLLEDGSRFGGQVLAGRLVLVGGRRLEEEAAGRGHFLEGLRALALGLDDGLERGARPRPRCRAARAASAAPARSCEGGSRIRCCWLIQASLSGLIAEADLLTSAMSKSAVISSSEKISWSPCDQPSRAR